VDPSREDFGIEAVHFQLSLFRKYVIAYGANQLKMVMVTIILVDTILPLLFGLEWTAFFAPNLWVLHMRSLSIMSQSFEVHVYSFQVKVSLMVMRHLNLVLLLNFLDILILSQILKSKKMDWKMMPMLNSPTLFPPVPTTLHQYK